MKTLADVHKAAYEGPLRHAWSRVEGMIEARGSSDKVGTANPHARLVINLEKQRGRE